MGKVLIDKHLVFDEDSFLLYRMDTEEEPLRLGAIASRCLSILLMSDGAVVRRRELMTGAWGQYGLEVTDNSLAQVVRQLRMAFVKLGMEREVIQTLPRIGYKLADGVKIQELSLATQSSSIPFETVPVDQINFSIPLETHQSDLRQTTTNTSASGSKEPVATASRPLSMVFRPWGLGGGLVVWGGVTFLLGKMLFVPMLGITPQVFALPVTMNDVAVHFSIPEVRPLTASYLQPLILDSRKLAELLEFSLDNIHLYVMPVRQGANQILCDGEVANVKSRCIGVQHD